MKKGLEIALCRRNPEFGTPDPEACDHVVSFGLSKHSLGRSNIDDRCQAGPIANLLLLLAGLSGGESQGGISCDLACSRDCLLYTSDAADE